MTDKVVACIERSGLKPGHIVVVFVFAYFAMQFALRAGAGAGWWSPAGQHTDLVVRSGAIIVGIAMFALHRDLRSAMAALFRPSVVPATARDMLLALAVTYTWALGVHPVLVKMPTVWMDPGKYLPFWGYFAIAPERPVGALLMTAIVIGFLTPVIEEFFFRGMLLNAWRVRRSLGSSIVLSSLVFGLIHGWFTVMAFGFGVIACFMFLRYRSLWPSIVVHGAYNALLIVPVLDSLSRRKQLPEAASVGAWAYELALATAFIPLAVLFWRRFGPMALRGDS